MKKHLLSLSLIVAFAFYALLAAKRSPDANADSAPSPAASSTPASTTAAVPTPRRLALHLGDDEEEGDDDAPRVVQRRPLATRAPQPTPGTQQQTPTTGTYKSGTYTGSPADAYYGTVQVRAVVSNGRIADVVFLSYPSDRQTSREINGQATPILRSEAIQAQNASVDIVSGATQTSLAFRESLAAALRQAQL